MWISGTAQYAIRAVLHLAQHGQDEPLRVEAIAEALDVPRNYLSKTLHTLARAGVLRSGRGPRGGFQLADDPRAISLVRVTAPFDDVGTRLCLLGRSACSWKNPCAVHPRWEAVSLALMEFFRTTTVADLLGEIALRPGMAPAAYRAPGRENRPVAKASGAAAKRRGAAAKASGGAAKARVAKRVRGPSSTRPKSS